MAGIRELEEARARALQRIAETHVAGQDTRHSREDNLLAVRELVAGHAHYTFGIRGVERFGEEEVLRAVADLTGCSKDLACTTGGGYISPRATLAGLEAAASAILRVARRGGRIMVATGHPGSMLLYYVELGRLIERWGGKLIQVEQGASVPPHFDLEYVEGVAALSDRCSLWHSHDTKAMEIIIGAARGIDLAVVDHGFAGAAINAGIPTVSVLDTNDPALAVAARMGADLVLIPMDDNRPLHVYHPIVETIRELAMAGETGRVPRRAIEVPRTEVAEQLAQADRLVRERLGDVKALDEVVDDLAQTFKDQFMQTHFDAQRDEGQILNPYVTLAVYRSLRDALDRFILDQIAQRRIDLTRDEIAYYLTGRNSREREERRVAGTGRPAQG